MYIYTQITEITVCRVGNSVCGCDIQKSDPINRHKKKKKKGIDMKRDQLAPPGIERGKKLVYIEQHTGNPSGGGENEWKTGAQSIKI